WKFLTSAGLHAFDLHLKRLNGFFTTSANLPPAAGTLTAASFPNGMIPNCSAGNAPRVVHTFFGANRWDETVPTGEATQVTLSGANNGYNYAIGSTVPTGIQGVGIYRGYVAGATTLYYWDQDVAVQAGSSFPTIKILQADALLRPDCPPPSWAQMLLTPEAAFLYALAFAAAPSGFSQATGLA